MRDQQTSELARDVDAHSLRRLVSGRSNTDLCADDARIACPLFQAEYGGVTPTSALQLRICKINSKLAVTLNKKWHSRMPQLDCYNICAPCFGAECGNIYYAIAMWSLPIAANRIKDGQQCLELRRMAIAPDAPKNTASRMLAIMTRMIRKDRPDIIRLLSYQDTEVHKGTIYAAAGWKAVRTSDFVSWDNHSKRPGKINQSLAPKVRWELAIRESANDKLTHGSRASDVDSTQNCKRG